VVAAAYAKPVEITADNFQGLAEDNQKSMFVKFYAP
jgi:hypothetical protein